MVPKPFQNRSWRGSGGHLGATLETRCFQDFIFDDLVSILEAPLGPNWTHFGNYFLILWRDGFLMALASIWAPKRHAKKDQKDGQNQKLEFIDGVVIYYACATFRGAFLDHRFGMGFGAHVEDFSSVLRSLLETIFVTVWVPFLHRFLDPLKTSQKWWNTGSRPTFIMHAPPLLKLLPPS